MCFFPLQPSERLQEVLAGKDVDLVDLTVASSVMRVQVIAHGERLYCSDEAVCEAFEDLVYSEYVRLQEERRDSRRCPRSG